MAAVLQVLHYAVGLVFVLLGLLTLRDYLRHPERSRGFLALAIGLLGAVSVVSLLPTPHGMLWSLVTAVDVAMLLFSAYALLLFRSSFIPLPRRTRRLVLAGILFVSAAFALVVLFEPKGPLGQALLAVVTLLLVFAWSACVGEPIYRFWVHSAHLPSVQQARLRSLSVGFSALVAIFLFAGVAGGLAQTPAAQLATQLIALLVAPLLYVSFAPPRWLRRQWMYPEEQAYRDAVQEMILFSPTRQRLAERALEWAIRFVGAEAGFIADADGSVLAARGMTELQAERLHTRLHAPGEYTTQASPDVAPQTAVMVPLPLSNGTGVLAVVSGPFTPFFGSDEVGRLTGYATNVTAGLDRAVLTERIAALERTKTEFLNLASHELRGPITVLRGYLDMLERGALGKIPPEAMKALPVLSAKADEMGALVEQMIEAARLEEGKLELTTKRADLNVLAQLAVEMARPFADDRHALVFSGSDGEVPVMVDVDRIGTVVGNLLTNAIKYSPEGGEVTCSVTTVDHRGLVAVSDHGVGISPDRFDKLFTRFGRIITPETSHIPGTGLGLYLSRELARLHGGDLTATSEPGKGSTFTLAVPLMEEAKA